MKLQVISSIVCLLSLSGCFAHQNRALSISCFANSEVGKAKQPVEGQGPAIVSNGTVIFYDADGSLRRVSDAVCGIKGGEAE